MAIRQPEVLTGYRGPRDETREPAPASPARTTPEGKTTFQFSASRYRLQLTAPRSVVLPDGRIEAGDRPLVVIAEDGFKTLDNVKDAKAIEMVKNHPQYGVDFWDYATVEQGLKKARTDQAIQTLQDPDSRAAILAALEQMGEDFKLPARKPAAKETAKE